MHTGLDSGIVPNATILQLSIQMINVMEEDRAKLHEIKTNHHISTLTDRNKLKLLL